MTRWQIETDESVKKFDLEQVIHSSGHFWLGG